MRRLLFSPSTLVLFTTLLPAWASGQVPTTLEDFAMPGSQPGDSGNLETPQKCDNCHGGYDQAVEPSFNWRGSMMAQAARDPIFYATMAIANQDAPDSGDLCLRCHSPAGWLEGRSIPTDGSALNNNDRESVQCDFCHKLVKPTPLGVNPYPDDPDYTADTYPADQTYLQTLADIPPTSGNGMYIVDSLSAKRGPFNDAAARHQALYSPFHKEAGTCGTCHDVSNPAFNRVGDGDTYTPNNFGQRAPDFSPYKMFPVERTYSEWLASEYNGPGGATCQDCHMQDVTGAGCNKKGAPVRTDLPLHDMTGGSTLMPALVAELFPDEVDPAALVAGMERAGQTLRRAATMTLTVLPNADDTFMANVRVVNETGHKLPSGYPEGRRIWINLKAYDSSGTVIYESGAYNTATGVLTVDHDAKVYQIKPGIAEELSGALGLPAGPSFHFVLSSKVFKDNRIPPRGFTNAGFAAIQSPVVAYRYEDGQYWDDTVYPSLPAETAQVTATLYYQSTSKEFIEFLHSENHTNDWGQVMYDLWNQYDKFPPETMATATAQNDGPNPTSTWEGGEGDWETANWHDGTSGGHQPPAETRMVINVDGSSVSVEQDFVSGGAGPAGSIAVGNSQHAELEVEATLEVSSDILIGPFGTLEGSGTVQVGNRVRVADGGTLAPGSSIGTLAVQGNVDLESGATMAVELSGSGEPVAGIHNDLLAVDNLTLTANPKLELVWRPGDVDDGLFGGVYTIAAYSGKLTGTFSAPTLVAADGGTDASIYIDKSYGVGGIDYGSGFNDVITVKLKPVIVGDANLDGDVDVWQFDGRGDAQVLSNNVGTTDGAVWSDGDFNFDGDVDVWSFDGSGDVQKMSENLGRSLSQP